MESTPGKDAMEVVEMTIMDLEYFDDTDENVDEDTLNKTEWHIESVDSSSADSFDEAHNPNLFPQYMEEPDLMDTENDIENDNAKEIGQKTTSIEVGGINYKVPLACLVGVLASLGLAIKKRNDRIKRNRKQKLKKVMNYKRFENYYELDKDQLKNSKR